MNVFEKLAEIGYTRTVPIIPPSAEISEKSSLHKRVNTHQDGRGKTPGIRWRDGTWSGFDWVPYEADARDYARWHEMCAGVGIKTGRGLYAIDADTLDEELAAVIEREVNSAFGDLPIRTGRAPKHLYLIRVAGDLPYMRVDFGQRDARGVPERVEILGDGRQFVAAGIHPKTGQPYRWNAPIPPRDEIHETTPEAMVAFLDRLRHVLPQASDLHRSGGTGEYDQAALRGDTATVRKAVAAIPNDHRFDTRESYLGVGYAIKAAVDDEHEAFEIWADWCERWTEGENDPRHLEADWSRMKPPYRRGAGWLYEQAESLSGGAFSTAEAWFQPIPEEENPFAQISLNPFGANSDTGLYPVLDVNDILTRPPAEWLVARHVPRHSVGFLYSRPGAGKSFLALDMALSIAAGRADWHGDEINATEGAQVLYLAAEGSWGFRNRVLAWCQERGVDPAALAGRFRMIEAHISFLAVEDMEKLHRTVRALVGEASGGASGPVVLTVVDTVSRAMPGADENLQKDMTLFVRACDGLRDVTGGAVLGVHHAGKNGDMRGSTVLLGAGDFVFKLEREKSASLGRLSCEKQKDGPDGWDDMYGFAKISLNPFGAFAETSTVETSLVVARETTVMGEGGAVSPEAAGRALDAMRAAWDAGAPWGCTPRARDNWAARIMAASYNWRAEDAEAALKAWESLGVIRAAVYDKGTKRRGYEVLQSAAPDNLSEGVFG